jgi:2-deoxy-D-gluconate 3-dehydrogenase
MKGDQKGMKTYLDQFDLSGRVAVVTGASEGIGRDLALDLARAGADLVICSRREQKLNEVKKKIEDIGRKAEVFVLDVCNIRNIKELKPFILDSLGKADVLVNSAGFSTPNLALDVTEKDWDAMVDTGLKGLFFCNQTVGSIMRDQKYGKIINLSSTYACTTAIGMSVYGTIKAGISHLTKILALEWATHGIRVNAIAPTAIKTPSREKFLKNELLEKSLRRIPLGRLATTEDLTGAAIYLASPASDFVTGQTLYVDGGWVAAG